MTTDPDRALAEVAAAKHGVFTIGDALGAQLSDQQIKDRAARRWTRLYDGVYRVAGAPPTWRGELLAATLAAGPGSAISHRAGAEIYELPGRGRDLVELTCVRWKRSVQPGLVVHESRRLETRDIQLVDGIPVTTPERTVLDIASCYPAANYLELVVQAARRKRLITYESMTAVFDRHAPWPQGRTRTTRDPGAMGPGESCDRERDGDPARTGAARKRPAGSRHPVRRTR